MAPEIKYQLEKLEHDVAWAEKFGNEDTKRRTNRALASFKRKHRIR